MKSDFHKGRWGTCFKNGKVYDFDNSSVLVMKGWPDPRAWVKTSRKGWHHDRKKADKFFSSWLFPESGRPPSESPDPSTVECPDYLNHGDLTDEERAQRWASHRKAVIREWKEKHQLADFFDRIPPEIRHALLQYSDRKWHLLNLFARCPGAFDLHVSNPALFYALASHWVFHKPAVRQPMRAARSLVRKKQKDIQRWLGFPATESARKILRRIPRMALSVENLLYLRDTLHDPERAKILAHLPRINAGALRLINDRRLMDHLAPRVIEEVGNDPENDDYANTYRMLIDLFRMNQQLRAGPLPICFHSLRRIKELHDELATRLDDAEYYDDDLAEPVVFPPPPYHGTETIVPISTPDELRKEGREMQHCVGSYARNVARGGCYIYRVLSPVRATLSITIRAGNWSLDQIQMASNKPVPREIREKIGQALLSSSRVEAKRYGVSPAEDGGPMLQPGVMTDAKGRVLDHVSSETQPLIDQIRHLFCQTS